jgi:sugar lactone lactonase YvrE
MRRRSARNILIMKIGCHFIWFWGVAFMAWAASAFAQSLTVTTLAGAFGARGSADGIGSAASFTFMTGIAADRTGNIYVADGSNFTVRKVTPSGVVTTLAGQAGAQSYVDGPGSIARFGVPMCIAVDQAGNVYVGDNGNGVVRKITPAGIVTTLAGMPGYRSADGQGKDAGFSGVLSLAVDPAGNVYVGDRSALRKITPAGVVTTVAGQFSQLGYLDGVGQAALFFNISALAVDSGGNIYAADPTVHVIRKITPAGVVSTFAGSASTSGSIDGPLATAAFVYPASLAFDGANNLYVADGNPHYTIRRISSAGIVTTIAGNPETLSAYADGVGFNAILNGAKGIAVDPSGTTFYIADVTAIRKGLSLPLAPQVVLQPKNQTAPVDQSATYRITANANPVPAYQWQMLSPGNSTWVNLADGANYSGTTAAVFTVSNATLAMRGSQFRCVVTNSLGTDVSTSATFGVDPPVIVVPLKISTLAGQPGASAGYKDKQGAEARFALLGGLAVDRIGNVLVVDSTNNRIRKVTPDGIVTTVAGSGAAGATDGVGTGAQFNLPADVAVDSAGNIFVADSACLIRKITPAGVVTTYAGYNGPNSNTPTVDGVFLSGPLSLAIDRADNLYVADARGQVILRITPTGIVTTVAGQRYVSGAADGAGTYAQFTHPMGLSTDVAGNIYVADQDSQTIRKITPAGMVTTIAGKPNEPGSTDGSGTNARFSYPSSTAVDPFGNIYVADFGNQTIRKIAPDGTVTTVAGVAPTVSTMDSSGSTDGIGSAARFHQPGRLATDRAGNIYIADYLNYSVRKGSPVNAVAQGDAVIFALSRTGSGKSAYQWRKNAADIPGATGNQYAISAARSADAGEYSVRVASDEGAAESSPVPLTVRSAHLASLSIRSTAGNGAQTLIVGFSIAGIGMPVLVRGIGPTLSQYGVASPLTAAQLAVHFGDTITASNNSWGNSPDIAAADARLGAFVLPGNSLDAAVLTTFDTGAYTAHCMGANDATGTALVEIYDASTSANCQLVSLSARSYVDAGDGLMIAGFSIAGTSSCTVMVRGIGPTLEKFGVSGVLPNSQLQLVDERGGVLAQNAQWGMNSDVAAITAATQATGAFALPTGSRDAVLLMILPPGTYSAQLRGANGATGVGLIEVYQVP